MLTQDEVIVMKTPAKLASSVLANPNVKINILTPQNTIVGEYSVLSYGQEQMIALHQMSPSTYNMPTTIKIDGAFDPAALRKSMELLTIAHPSLRTVVDFQQMRQRVLPEAEAASCFELRELDADDMAAAIKIIEQDSIREFELAGPVVFRGTLVTLKDGGEGASATGVRLLLLNQHHLGSDGGSRTVMRQQLLRTYRAVLLGLPDMPLPKFSFTVRMPMSSNSTSPAFRRRMWCRVTLPTDNICHSSFA